MTECDEKKMFKVPKIKLEVFLPPEQVNFLRQIADKFHYSNPSQVIRHIITTYMEIFRESEKLQKERDLEHLKELQKAKVVK